MIGRQVYSLEVKYTQNEFEFNRQITHVYLGIKFRPLSKISIVEIDVNPVTYEEISAS